MIAEAYKEEQAYLADKTRGIDSSFTDRLKPYGFTIEEYHEAKKDYQFILTPPKMRYVYISEFLDFNRSLSKSEAYFYMPIFTSRYVAFVGIRNELYKDKCEGVDIEIMHTKFRGGTLVESVKDIHFMIAMPTKVLDMDYFNSRILPLVWEYEPSAYQDGNDFMLEGKKFCGTSFFETETKQFYGLNISFEDTSELCKKILPPRSVKPVGCLTGDYRDELEAKIIAEFNGVM